MNNTKVMKICNNPRKLIKIWNIEWELVKQYEYLDCTLIEDSMLKDSKEIGVKITIITIIITITITKNTKYHHRGFSIKE